MIEVLRSNVEALSRSMLILRGVFLKQRFHFPRIFLHIEKFFHSLTRIPAQAQGEFVVIEQLQDGRGKPVNVSGGNNEARHSIHGSIRQTAVVGNHRGLAHGHGLEVSNAQTLDRGGRAMHKEVRERKNLRNVSAPTRKKEMMDEPEILDPVF